ncbi:50S ribosomal protein L3 glutamine methyltransferase [Streptomyces sp. RB5]|uniref:peptide chain release factor N(5)-glutamine methyltransferase n=1 Tax=Streptomyces smaragdinus TaxID=2585196 RepID=A0A7K0CQC2_9ACTN|nr:50S ribosomal protein L3 glutamine methyltransferase [Streptomyces smaragdinus]
MFAEEEARLLLEAAGGDALEALVRRRVGGEPLEYVVGWAQFAGLQVVVAEGVFVPRRRSEFLARCAADLARPGDVVVDLCCGAGAVGAAVAAWVPGVSLHAADVDPAAVAVARRNVPGAVYEGDLYAALPGELRGRVDVLVANAPYIPTGEIPLLPAEARLYEPPVALDGGDDGLDVQRRIAAGAAGWLAPGGTLLIETSERQAPLTVAAFEAGRLEARVETCEDLAATVVLGSHAA